MADIADIVDASEASRLKAMNKYISQHQSPWGWETAGWTRIGVPTDADVSHKDELMYKAANMMSDPALGGRSFGDAPSGMMRLNHDEIIEAIKKGLLPAEPDSAMNLSPKDPHLYKTQPVIQVAPIAPWNQG